MATRKSSDPYLSLDGVPAVARLDFVLGALASPRSILAFDLSTKTGWCLVDLSPLEVYYNTNKDIVCRVRVRLGKLLSNDNQACPYPENYLRRAESIAQGVRRVIANSKPDLVVIEETNGSRSRYTQKMLEYIHYAVLQEIRGLGLMGSVRYINTSSWRAMLGLNLSKDDKKRNARLARGLRSGKTKKDLGIKGKINKKHLAVSYTNDRLVSLTLKMKDNDVAEAMCIAIATAKGIYDGRVSFCDGKY